MAVASPSRARVVLENGRTLFTRLFTPRKIKVNASSRPAPPQPAQPVVPTTVATNDAAPAVPAPAAPSLDLGEIKVRGISSGAKSSAVLDVGGRNYSVCVDDEFSINRPTGKLGVRCEKIEAGSVWLRILTNDARVEIRLADPGAAKP